ncbi:MAG: hypothetical protein AAGA05_01775 [Pseudomonadota bacterium]
MFGSVVLELFIGVTFLFLVLSLAVTTAQELIAGLLGLRSGNLILAIRNLLDDEKGGLVSEVFDHPTMRRLYRGKVKRRLGGYLANGPSYVPSNVFSTALLDTLRVRNTSGQAQPVSIEDLFGMAPEIVREMPNGSLKRALTLMIGQVSDPDRPLTRRIETVEQRLSQWYDEAMHRASGWYKRKSQAISLILSVAIVVAVNANALTYMETLWKDASLREAIVASAEAAAAAAQPLNPDATEVLDQIGQFPIGWANEQSLATVFQDPLAILKTLAGWAITVLAISLGAAFWFDLTKKALALRASGPKPSDTAT